MTRLHLIIFLVIFGLILFLLSSISFGLFKERSEKIRGYTDTHVIKIFEYGSDIILRNYKITEEQEGTCTSKSHTNLRPDAYNCSTKNASYDPCFLDNRPQNHTKVACLKSPWESNLVVINLKAPLPTPNELINFYEADPWSIELDGNINCILKGDTNNSTTHSMAGIENQSICYTSQGKKADIKIFNKIDRSKTFWIAIVDDGHHILTTKKINAAYY